MPTPIPYSRDWLFELPLITVGEQSFISGSPTIEVGDVKVRIDSAAEANTTARILGFDSMSVFPTQGDQISGSSGQTAVVMFTKVISGTTGSNNASGFYYVKNVSGTWNDNDEVHNETTGVVSMSKADSGTTGTYTSASAQLANVAGLFAFAESTAFVAITATETQCFRGGVRVIDSITKEWEDTGEDFRTTGHPKAEYQPEGNRYVLSDGLISGSATDQVYLPGLPSAADGDYVGYQLVVKDVNTGAEHARWITNWNHASRSAFLDTDLPFTPQNDVDEYAVLSRRYDTIPQSLGSQAKSDVLESVDSSTAASNINTKPSVLLTVTAHSSSGATVSLSGSSAVSVDDTYNLGVMKVRSGTGIGQHKVITDYDGTLQHASLVSAFTTTLDNTSVIEIIEGSVSIGAVQSSPLAATNLGNFFNNTGYNASVSSIGTVATASLVETASVVVSASYVDTVSTASLAETASVVISASLVDTVSTLTGHTPQTGDSFARIGAPVSASLSLDIASIKNDLLYTAISESYAADGAPATPAELLYMLYSLSGELFVSGSTVITRQLDGGTTAMTYLLDDPTSPTSMSRIS